jgi:hypothetical protein
MQIAANVIPQNERKAFSLNGGVVAVVEIILVLAALAALFSVALFHLGGSASELEPASIRSHTIGPIPGIIGLVLAVLIVRGFRIVQPDQALVLFSGKQYAGTVRGGGLIWTNPFLRRRKISLQPHTFTETQSPPSYPNQKLTATLRWKVKDTALFDAENSGTTIRNEMKSLLQSTAAHLSDKPKSADIENFNTQITSQLKPLGIEVQSTTLHLT